MFPNEKLRCEQRIIDLVNVFCSTGIARCISFYLKRLVVSKIVLVLLVFTELLSEFCSQCQLYSARFLISSPHFLLELTLTSSEALN